MNLITRREFLKLLSLMPLVSVRGPRFKGVSQRASAKNILIIVFDAWTSKNIQMFGYPRETMPKLAQLSEKAIVYHNHHAGSDFTTPGTASLLTGTLPWTHRAFHRNGRILPRRIRQNLFNAFPDYFSIGYSHNVLVNTLLNQMLDARDLKEHLPFHEMMLYSDWVERLFSGDNDLASVSRFFIFDKENPLTSSLFLGKLTKVIEEISLSRVANAYKDLFPRGLPRSTKNTHYTLGIARQWLTDNLPNLPQPFLGYFHFLPPHDPYRPPAQFVDLFDDGWQPEEKPEHIFHSNLPLDRIQTQRQYYDEFIAYVDDEFDKLYAHLEQQGILENTILVLTSDHGEIFERGMLKHGTNTFHEPILRVPLLIFEPGRSERIDVHAPTSAIDILPTLAYLSERDIPQWAEGFVLPPFANIATEREVFALAAIDNRTSGPLIKDTVALVKNGYKLMAYEGYEQLPRGEPYYELYDIENDPEELENLYESRPILAADMLDALLESKTRADEEFA